MNSFVADTRNSDNDFFSSISRDLSDFSNEFFNNIAPNWAAKELGVQRSDQMQDALYNQNTDQPTLQNYQSTTETGGVQQTGFLFDNISVSGTALLGVAVAIVAGIALARM